MHIMYCVSIAIAAGRNHASFSWCIDVKCWVWSPFEVAWWSHSLYGYFFPSCIAWWCWVDHTLKLPGGHISCKSISFIHVDDPLKLPGQAVLFYHVLFPWKGHGQHAAIKMGCGGKVMPKNLSCDWSVCIWLRGFNWKSRELDPVWDMWFECWALIGQYD